MKKIIAISFTAAVFITTSHTLPAQVVVNEIYINAVVNDGSPNPDTGEWIEFYNTTGSPVDISCWVFCDGDFCVTIPDGTTITGSDFFLVGSAAGVACAGCDFNGITIDLDWATCGCTAGTLIGTFTNSGEQVVLFDDTGGIIDAVYWNGGQGLPDGGNSSLAIGVCNAQTLNIPVASDPVFEDIGSAGGNGQSKSRSTNGGTVWLSESSPTPGSSNTPLPVTLMYFNAAPVGNKVELSWSTASEINNHFFTVERSADALNFTTLLTMEGAGNTSSQMDYSVVDRNPLPGLSYYRLRQTDFDGTTEVFDVVPVNFGGSGDLVLFPQPAEVHSPMVLRFRSDRETSTEVNIMTSSGQIIYEMIVPAEKGINEIQLPAVKNPGIYIAILKNSRLFHRQQVVIR